MVSCFDQKDFDEFKKQAHSLKGASSYIGAGFIYYNCYFIQELIINKRYDEVWQYYPCLVEAAIDYSVYHRKLLADLNNSVYNVKAKHEVVPHSSSFRLLKDQQTQKIYCCRLD